MVNLDLSKNNLNDDFAVELAAVLKSNDILHTVDISGNPFIRSDGAYALVIALNENNETLESLGDLHKNPEMGI